MQALRFQTKLVYLPYRGAKFMNATQCHILLIFVALGVATAYSVLLASGGGLMV